MTTYQYTGHTTTGRPVRGYFSTHNPVAWAELKCRNGLRDVMVSRGGRPIVMADSDGRVRVP